MSVERGGDKGFQYQCDWRAKSSGIRCNEISGREGVSFVTSTPFGGPDWLCRTHRPKEPRKKINAKIPEQAAFAQCHGYCPELGRCREIVVVAGDKYKKRVYCEACTAKRTP